MKYFFNLEKTRYEKIISQLKIGEDKFVSDFKRVIKEIENNYNQFYKTSFKENDTLESFQRFVLRFESTLSRGTREEKIRR